MKLSGHLNEKSFLFILNITLVLVFKQNLALVFVKFFAVIMNVELNVAKKTLGGSQE